MTILTHKWNEELHMLDITSDDFDLTIRKRVWEPRYERYSSYVSAPRIYVHFGDFNLVEDLMNRTRRPYTEYRKFIESVVWPTLGWDTIAPKIGWRKNAGCNMCPCSPGFVVQSDFWRPVERIGEHFDMWITIKTPDFVNVDERKPARTLTFI